jgi:hypothetical protein
MLRQLTRRAVVRYSIWNRRRKAELIISVIRERGLRSVILSGAGAAHERNENIVEQAILAEADVVCGFDIVHRGSAPWRFIVADGRRLPFLSESVDLIVSNAVIEHVGRQSDQAEFVREHCRVARCAIITTPNRWFPVESHTSAIFRHWSAGWRDQRSEFTRLLSRREFRAMLPDGSVVHGRPWSSTFLAVIAAENPVPRSSAR